MRASIGVSLGVSGTLDGPARSDPVLEIGPVAMFRLDADESGLGGCGISRKPCTPTTC